MADSSLSALSATTNLLGASLFYSDDGTNDIKVTATQISTFTLGGTVLTVAKGGTGFSASYATGTIIAGNGATFTMVAAGSSGTVLTADPGQVSGLTFTTVTGGAGSPGGASGTVQFNDGGSFNGMSGTSWNNASRTLVMTASAHA